MHTDGYTVYDIVAAKHGLRHAGCLSHTRRKFTDLRKASPEVTVPILLYIQRIYHIEKQARQTAAPPACRNLIRQARSRPIAEKLHRRSLIFLFTDMLQPEQDAEKLFEALRHLKHNKHELVLFHVYDKATEYDFKFDNAPKRFVDVESSPSTSCFIESESFPGR